MWEQQEPTCSFFIDLHNGVITKVFVLDDYYPYRDYLTLDTDLGGLRSEVGH